MFVVVVVVVCVVALFVAHFSLRNQNWQQTLYSLMDSCMTARVFDNIYIQRLR